MTIVGFILSCLLLVCGTALASAARNDFQTIFALFMLYTAGFCMALTLAMSGALGSFHHNDPDDCVQLAWLDESWKCVPVEEAG